MKRKTARRKKKVVAVSGGFDPIHIGHVRLFERAKSLGDELVVILNNDNWLRKKKHHAFMPDYERMEVIKALRPVDRVVLTKHGKNPKDMSVSRELRELRPHILANGGDRNKKDAANPASSLYKDINTCKELGIATVFNVGDGGKVQSSSWLLEKYVKRVSGTRARRRRAVSVARRRR
ncbi:MAG: adenylyltransferase/cytidyltransferase family protein [Minisyncoccia bacterium]|jgi:D-beta-D-heptose 7-phosphate kinase/D-beta-D-heptose 1-phosphate adenosyltransferase